MVHSLVSSRTLWGENFGECTTCRESGDPSWLCPSAVSVYADIGGSGTEIVEMDGATGEQHAPEQYTSTNGRDCVERDLIQHQYRTGIAFVLSGTTGRDFEQHCMA